MKNLEMNKIAAAVLVAGLIAMVSGKVADFLYHPQKELDKRGFQVEVAESESAAPGAAAAPEAPVDIPALLAAAKADNGQKIFAKCAACHTVDKGGANRVGPNLFGVVGAPKAHHAGYAYSDALKAKGGNWSEEDLFHFLAAPAKFVPGTKMTFQGLKKPEDKADIIAYLKAQK